MICHYVSKQIVKSWKNKNSKLVIYDIGNDSIEEINFSDELFSKSDFMSISEENFFNKKIENHLVTLSKNWDKITPIIDGNLANALFMYLFLQTERITQLNQNIPATQKFSSMTTQKFKEFSQHMKQRYVIYTNKLEVNSLFCSEVGLFSVPITNDTYTKDDFSFAAAIRPNLYLLILPKQYSQSYATTINNNIGIFSFGLANRLNRVIVPDYYYQNQDFNQIKETLKYYLSLNTGMVNVINMKNEMVEIVQQLLQPDIG